MLILVRFIARSTKAIFFGKKLAELDYKYNLALSSGHVIRYCPPFVDLRSTISAFMQR